MCEPVEGANLGGAEEVVDRDEAIGTEVEALGPSE